MNSRRTEHLRDRGTQPMSGKHSPPSLHLLPTPLHQNTRDNSGRIRFQDDATVHQLIHCEHEQVQIVQKRATVHLAPVRRVSRQTLSQCHTPSLFSKERGSIPSHCCAVHRNKKKMGKEEGTYRRSMAMASRNASSTVAKMSSFCGRIQGTP